MAKGKRQGGRVISRRFEVRIYNARVRELLEHGETNNTGLSDRWADAVYESIMAASPQEAVKLMRQKFPPAQGFVVTNVLLVTETGVQEIRKHEYES
ncbi:MAG: hypothetical protein GC134_06060 [Proteobacteria bacterium]|nr:hypothetical protein [Pseudomonadota bacterium]